MTPDELPADMEGRPAEFADWLHPRDTEPNSNGLWQNASDLRALLLAYQEQRRALEAASPVVPVGVSEVLDAAAAYLKDQYGASHGPLYHPVDRARIIAALRPTDTGRE
jgi:hypothetical protein